MGHGQIKGFNEIETGEIGREQNLGPDRALQIGLGDVSRGARDSFAHKIAKQ
jgi:hypothetical protein